ncbi:hypothetical protein ACP4OV_011682 [Aristida adscensionis]
MGLAASLANAGLIDLACAVLRHRPPTSGPPSCSQRSGAFSRRPTMRPTAYVAKAAAIAAGHVVQTAALNCHISLRIISSLRRERRC